jgi:adenosylcobinamide-GDP ribazoletransferase
MVVSAGAEAGRPSPLILDRPAHPCQRETRAGGGRAAVLASSDVRSLALALRYLTIAPIPVGPHVEPTTLGRAAPWFPVIGLGLGLLVAGVERVTALVFPALLGALLTVTAWKLLTGGLHLDGLSDCLDGLMGRDPSDRLRIMRDSRIGAFGAIGLILFLLLEVAAVSELAASMRWRTLLVAPAVARAMPPLAAWLFRGATPHGHGAMFRSGLTRSGVLAALGLAALIALGALGAKGAGALALAAAATVALGWFYTRRLGGVTGDVLGATIELAELVVLLTLVGWTGGGR